MIRTPGFDCGGYARAVPAQREYSEGERLEQLSEFGESCRELAEILSRHPQASSRAGSYEALAEEADRLIKTRTPSRDDLHRLSRALPEAPEWLNPKAVDSGLPTERWQKKFGRIHTRTRELALWLRAVGESSPT